MASYKKEIYADYVTGFKGYSLRFDAAQARRWGRPYRAFLKGWLPDGNAAHILDVGCGDGRLLQFFKDMGYSQLTGIDISPEQATLARQVVKDITVDDAISFLERNEGKFDFIAALDIIEHFEKELVIRFLNACFAALKAEGRLVLQAPNGESPWCSAILYGDFTHEWAFQPRLLAILLSRAGFSEIRTREAGPVLNGILSLMRILIWNGIKLFLTIWNLAESGSRGSGIYTRVFFICGKKTRAKEGLV